MTKTSAKTKTNRSDAAVESTTGSSGVVRRFECEDGTSKFWEVRIDGDQLHIGWGKLGTGGQSQTKSFPSAEKARREQDKLIAEKIKKGYTEVGGSAGASAKKQADASSPDAMASPAKKKTTPALASPPRTFEDFREATFGLVREHPSWQEAMVLLIVEWSHTADDVRVMQWIEQLEPKGGWRSLAAGRVAVERARTDKASAARFVAVAETALPAEETAKARALEGLIPAWWRVGKQAQGDEGLTALKARMAADDLDSTEVTHTLFGLAALGGQRSVLEALLPATMKRADYEGPLRTALPALLADGFDTVFDALMKKWSKQVSSGESDTSRVLLAYLLREGKPEAFLELALRFPKIVKDSRHVRIALCALEKDDATRAVSLSSRLLAAASIDDKEIQCCALAVLARHAAAKVDAWAKRSPEHTKAGKPSCLPYLAALGRTEAVREALKAVEPGAACLRMLAQVTPDRALAIEALKQYLDPSQEHFNGRVLVWMADLGEPAFVESYLNTRLEQNRALPERERECREVARTAGMVGRIDLAMTAVALPSKSERRYVAKDGVAGCALVGDWTGAFTLLEKVPNDTSNGRVSCAVHALTCASEADGPRAVPLRVTAD
ncbi:WGR domain-containing protein [Nannocystis radixulma]|uniref:WGR domain-containing protein n=1 Tax=Nannocystis radixulma TaxID=2995305 RepID=A0ABT5BRF8_9BACT|nr:WGR domain-containing protein [Nannocystis radixulma]MDC0675983.1 WGR domain-containing protein [Nannocystis radixulma]